MTSQPPSRTFHWLSRLLLLTIFISAFAAFHWFGLGRYADLTTVKSNLDDLRSWMHEHWITSIGIYVLTYVIVTALSLPIATMISLVGGALFGRWMGTLLVSLSATTGASLAFLGSRYLLRETVEKRFGARLQRLNEGIAKEGGYYLFTLRLLPIVPFFLINLGMGLTKMKLAVFAGVSWVGMLPGTFVYVNAGTEIASISSVRDIFSFRLVASFALLGLLPWIMRLLLRGITRRDPGTPPMP